MSRAVSVTWTARAHCACAGLPWTGHFYCACCDQWLNGPSQWVDHVARRRHKRKLCAQGGVPGTELPLSEKPLADLMVMSTRQHSGQLFALRQSRAASGVVMRAQELFAACSRVTRAVLWHRRWRSIRRPRPRAEPGGRARPPGCGLAATRRPPRGRAPASPSGDDEGRWQGTPTIAENHSEQLSTPSELTGRKFQVGTPPCTTYNSRMRQLRGARRMSRRIGP